MRRTSAIGRFSAATGEPVAPLGEPSKGHLRWSHILTTFAQPESTVADQAQSIAAELLQRYGLEGARAAALAEVLKAQEAKNNYALSIWREVRQILSKEAEERP